MHTDRSQRSNPLTGAQSAAPKPRCETSLADLARMEVAEWEEKLRPASKGQIASELLRCLTLVAPTGMTQADREEWLMVALPEVAGIPASVFEDACQNARRTCDHPAKIIAAIIGHKPPHYRSTSFMQSRLSQARAKLANINAPRLEASKVDEDERRKLAISMGELARELERKASAETLDARK